MVEHSEAMDALVDAVADAEHFQGEDPEWPEWLGELDINELMELVASFAAEARHIDAVRTELKERMAHLLGDNGRIHDGHTFYRYTVPRKRYILQEDKFWQLVALAPDMVFHPADMRIGGIRQLMRKYAAASGYEGEEQDEYVAKMEEDMIQWRPAGPPKLQQVLLDRAPEYAREMKPGEIRRSHKKGPKR